MLVFPLSYLVYLNWRNRNSTFFIFYFYVVFIYLYKCIWVTLQMQEYQKTLILIIDQVYQVNNIYNCGLDKNMKNSKMYEQNQKLLILAFNAQNIQAYDEAYEKLQVVGNNLISIIEGIQKNTQFYMRVMPILKQQRQLISQKDYKQFLHKNERVLCKNLQQNAYLALLMQEIQQKTHKQVRKWTNKQDSLLAKMVSQSFTLQEIYEKFTEYDMKQVKRKYQKAIKKINNNPNPKPNTSMQQEEKN